MSKISEFLNTKVVSPVDEEILEGKYGCAECTEDVDIARFSSSTGRLYWTCQNNHVTEVYVV